MTFLESIESDIFSEPKVVGTEGMKRCLETNFAEYKKILSSISDVTLAREISQQANNIDAFCRNILSSLGHYQTGYVAAAYFDFTKAMDVLKPILFPENKGGVVRTIGLYKPLYRARVGNNIPYSKGGMFHLPFPKREYASTQRFSIPGLPCLYLSNSIYVCWEELNRPSINKLQVSRFQQENFNLNILNLSMTANQIKISCKLNAGQETSSKYDYDFIAFWFLITWPLSFICSLTVTNEDAPFKHEYIFPQFLLQWVTSEKEVDGIKYFSVKSNPYNKDDFSQFTNYVFPPKKMDYGNYCSHLKESFKLTDPVSLEIFQVADPNLIFISKEWLDNVKYKVMIDNIRLELIPGFQMPYTHTLFGKLEVFMQNLEVDFLSEREMGNNSIR